MADTDLLTDKKGVREKLKDYRGSLGSGEWESRNTRALSTNIFVFSQRVPRPKARTGIMKTDGFFVDLALEAPRTISFCNLPPILRAQLLP